MKLLRYLTIIFTILFPSLAFCAAEAVYDQASDIETSTTNFNNNLSSADTNVQKALDTIDNLSITGAPTSAHYYTDQAEAGLSAEIVLTGLSTLNGITKGNGSGGFSAASAGTDYIAPYGSQTAKYFLAAPNASDGTPSFRAIVASDIPALSYQAQHANLTSLAGLTYASTSFVKMTGANTFTLDTNTYQAADADLTTYAGITPSANAQTLLGETFAQMQGSLSIDDLITLSGVAEGSVNLATFTGTTIADNVTIKAALQALETAVEGKQASDSDLTTWAGITPGANVGTFLATPSSANLLAAITDETGSASGSPLAVFNVNPTLVGATFTGTLTLGENGILLDPAISGDGYYSGITEGGTAGATLAFGDLVYFNNDDSRWELADANLSDGYDKKLGIVVLAAAGDGSATTLLLYGKVNGATAFPTMTVGAVQYMSETAGDITGTAPTTTDAATRVLGYANTADELFFCPSRDYYTHT